MAFFISRKKFQNIRPTNNGFTITQRKSQVSTSGLFAS
ncbi:hypothetical protein LEP1GSC067_4692 [Leptospira interrogans serovar Lora str. TE 1992]|uniref:Uncharacterized protein n=1 Tax=Leptospira interrogans serovar Lora str. TE 1992 TaxID=1193028 RepID=M3DLW1_LEPIR|nr:hypothetical protein LEP1GSC067_4692 [Leptospira interrogans serovar Lora str. TE 1992]